MAAGGGGGGDAAVVAVEEDPLFARSVSLIAAVRGYVERMLKGIEGMKVLIVDKETKGIISMVFGMSDLMSKEVFHVTTLDQERSAVKHMKGLAFLRANADNLRLLKEELRDPKCSEYHLFFSNILPAGYLNKLAECDERSVVMQVQEFYADFYPINSDLFSLNLGASLTLERPTGSAMGHLTPAEATFLRSVDGCAGVLLAFKVRPFVRFQQASASALAFAKAMDALFVSQRELFHFSPPPHPAMLLVLDRKEDPITPLLSQWTYQAMVHELLGLWNNRVDLSSGPPPPPGEDAEVVLSVCYDAFFRRHIFSNFGDFAEAVQATLREYQEKRKMHGKIASIEDMQRLVESMPELRKQSSEVSKHVRLMSEINRAVDSRQLMDVSQVEQEIVCGDDQSGHFRSAMELISSPGIEDFDALRLVVLYALRYETAATGPIEELKRALLARGIGRGDVALVDAALSYGGVARRGSDLFGTGSVLGRLTKTMSRSLRGVQNVYTQHEPLLHEIITDMTKQRLSKSMYPFIGAEMPPADLGTVVVFVLGGVTYEEAAVVAKHNAAMAAAGLPTRILLGGTAIHNSKSFLAELRRLGGGATAEVAAGRGVL